MRFLPIRLRTQSYDMEMKEKPVRIFWRIMKKGVCYGTMILRGLPFFRAFHGQIWLE